MIHNSLPGMSIEEITTVIQNLAEQENRPAREVALDQARIAVNAQTKAANPVTATPRSSSNGSDNRSALGAGKRAGDMFWTDSTTGRFIHHGHTGIYVSTTKIAEAPGTGLKSHTMEASRKLVADRRKFRISTSSSVLNSQTPPKAVSWANKHLGIDYNNNFIANKHVDWGTYNCSQFVWAAYMSGGSGIPKVDLDSNGGSGVHPKDIRESKFVKVV